MRYATGRTRFLGRALKVDVPITLSARDYEGTLIYGSDGAIYYSDGVTWKPPMVIPPISRPVALTPLTPTHRTQLRLSNFYSSLGLTQAGVNFRVALSAAMTPTLFARSLNSTTANLYQITGADFATGITFGSRIFWTGSYSATGQESDQSAYQELVLASAIEDVVPSVNSGAALQFLGISDFTTGWNVSFVRTEWEIYNNPAGTGSPLYSTTNTASTLEVPELGQSQMFYWRARRRGYFNDLGYTVYSAWSALQSYVQNLPRYNVLSSAGTQYAAPRIVLASGGTSYAVPVPVLSAAGTSYTPI